ncbi:MAG: hypothetical protein ABSG64_04125 [Solirubrobacteraceae bacterium]|jgi:hypothetical protein
MAGASLLCPGCASSHNADERFCPLCGMPLVVVDGEVSVSERQDRARKIDPQYTEGPLVRVAWASNQAEAELIAGMLLEEGMPSLVRRAPGFDVPDFMAGGPREILVPASGVQAAHDTLLHAELIDDAPRKSTAPAPTRLLAGLLLAIAIVTVVLFMATHAWD